MNKIVYITFGIVSIFALLTIWLSSSTTALPTFKIGVKKDSLFVGDTFHFIGQNCTWNFRDSTTSEQANHVYTQSGSFTVLATNKLGRKDSITIHVLEQESIDTDTTRKIIALQKATIRDTVIFKNVVEMEGERTWDFGEGTLKTGRIAFGNTVSYNFRSLGKKRVKLTIGDSTFYHIIYIENALDSLGEVIQISSTEFKAQLDIIDNANSTRWLPYYEALNLHLCLESTLKLNSTELDLDLKKFCEILARKGCSITNVELDLTDDSSCIKTVLMTGRNCTEFEEYIIE